MYGQVFFSNIVATNQPTKTTFIGTLGCILGFLGAPEVANVDDPPVMGGGGGGGTDEDTDGRVLRLLTGGGGGNGGGDFCLSFSIVGSSF